MAGEAAAVAALVQTLQIALSTVSTVELFKYDCPPAATVANLSTFSEIIIGAGTAGTVVANRLAAAGEKVLLVESGVYPRFETVMPGMFTLNPNMPYDWNYPTVNNGVTGQNLQNGAVMCTAGKILGGSSSVQHMIHYQGPPSDYIPWANAVNDSSWNYTALQEYILKSEKMEDPTILASEYASYHGTTGNLRLTREPNELNIPLLGAFKEIGLEVRSDVSGTDSFGVCEPILNIADGERQCGARGYLTPVKDLTNLYLLTESTVTEILFDSNNVATGVKYVDSAGDTYIAYAEKEVVLAAGAIASPHLLMNSGFGPSEELEAAGITVKEDLPYVGKYLHDHIAAPFVVALNASNTTGPASNPHIFPAPLTTAYFDYDNDGSIPDFQIITLLFPPLSSGLLQLCMVVFKFTESICQQMYDASAGRYLLFVIPNISHPKSYGELTLNQTDPSANPIIDLGTYSNSEDKVNMGLYLAESYKLFDTTLFEAVDAQFETLGLCSDYEFPSTEFWECYAVAMSSTMWHFSGTCAMGKVVNNRLEVNGASHLRAIGAAAMPSLPSGNINAPLVYMAEKGADMILEDWNII